MRQIGSIISHKFVREGLLLSFIVAFLIGLQALLTPRIHDIRYTYGNKTERVSTAQVSIKVIPKQNLIEGWASMNFQPWQNSVFHISGDDCLLGMEINGEKVIEIPPLCTIGLAGVNIDLAKYLRKGSNQLHLKARDTIGVRTGFSIAVSQQSLWMKILNLITIILITVWIFTLASRTFLKHQPGMQALLGTGFLMRVLYVSATPSMVRDHDGAAHMEYIYYVLDHWIVPAASLGFEFHQGPLYYFAMAIIMKVAVLLGFGGITATNWMQFASLFVSCLSLVVAAWCAILLFPEERVKKSRILYFTLLAFFPALVFFSSRINNDVLFQLLSFVFLGCLLSWWKKGTTQWLLVTSVVIGLGFLTKANCYLFVPITLICIIFRPHTTPRQRYLWICHVIGVTAIIAGWLLVLRYLQHDFIRLMAPGSGLNRALSVSNSWSAYTTFRPLDIILQPYTSTWNDDYGRQYFWVFLFKTSLFGEFFHPKNLLLVSRILSVLFMGALAMAALGIGRSIKKNDLYLIPLLVCLIIILEGAFGYRWLHPAASNQDFRYSLLLLPLLSYFAVRATEIHGKVGMVLRAWLLAFSVCCMWFLFSLSIQP